MLRTQFSLYEERIMANARNTPSTKMDPALSRLFTENIAKGPAGYRIILAHISLAAKVNKNAQEMTLFNAALRYYTAFAEYIITSNFDIPPEVLNKSFESDKATPLDIALRNNALSICVPIGLYKKGVRLNCQIPTFLNSLHSRAALLYKLCVNPTAEIALLLSQSLHTGEDKQYFLELAKKLGHKEVVVSEPQDEKAGAAAPIPAQPLPATADEPISVKSMLQLAIERRDIQKIKELANERDITSADLFRARMYLANHYARTQKPIKAKRYYHDALTVKNGPNREEQDVLSFFLYSHWPFNDVYTLNERLAGRPDSFRKNKLIHQYGQQPHYIIQSLIFSHYSIPQNQEFIKRYPGIYEALKKLFGWEGKEPRKADAAYELFVESEKLLVQKNFRGAFDLFLFTFNVYQSIYNQSNNDDEKKAVNKELIKNLIKAFSLAPSIYQTTKKKKYFDRVLRRLFSMPDFKDPTLLNVETKRGNRNFVEVVYTTAGMPDFVRKKIIDELRIRIVNQAGEPKYALTKQLILFYTLTPPNELNLQEAIRDIQNALGLLKEKDEAHAKLVLEAFHTFAAQEHKGEYDKAHEATQSLETLARVAGEQFKSEAKREEGLANFDKVLKETKDLRLVRLICQQLVEKRPSSLHLKEKIDAVLLRELPRLGFSDDTQKIIKAIEKQESQSPDSNIGRFSFEYLRVANAQFKSLQITSREGYDLFALDYLATNFPIPPKGIFAFFSDDKVTFSQRLFLSAMICLLIKDIKKASQRYELPESTIKAIYDRNYKFINQFAETKENKDDTKKEKKDNVYQKLASIYISAIHLTPHSIQFPESFLEAHFSSREGMVDTDPVMREFKLGYQEGLGLAQLPVDRSEYNALHPETANAAAGASAPPLYYGESNEGGGAAAAAPAPSAPPARLMFYGDANPNPGGAAAPSAPPSSETKEDGEERPKSPRPGAAPGGPSDDHS